MNRPALSQTRLSAPPHVQHNSETAQPQGKPHETHQMESKSMNFLRAIAALAFLLCCP
jgi:hypothetical protein